MDIITRQEALAQGLTHFFTGKPCKYGHVARRFASRGQCLECNRITAAARYHSDPKASREQNKAWRTANRDAYLKAQRKYYENNKERILETMRDAMASPEAKAKKAETDRAYRERNQAALKEQRRAYYLANKAQLLAKGAEYTRRRAKVDPAYRLTRCLRKRVWDAIVNQYKSTTTLELIGCTVPSLMAHLEAQFADGMSWSNYGEWHIDHIIPCASFDLTDLEQQKACFHWSNLQPLWAEDNLRKGAKLVA